MKQCLLDKTRIFFIAILRITHIQFLKYISIPFKYFKNLIGLMTM